MIMNSPDLAASSPSETCLRQICERARGRRGEEACSISRAFRRLPLALQAALADVVGDVDVEDRVLDGDAEPGLVVVCPGDLAFDHERVTSKGVPADGVEDASSTRPIFVLASLLRWPMTPCCGTLQ